MTFSPQHAPRAQSDIVSGNMFGVTSMVLWAAGFPAAEVLLQNWPPLALIAVRFTLASLVLTSIWLMIDGVRAVKNAHWGAGLLIGGTCFGMGAYLLLVAQKFTDPLTVALIASATPIASTLIEMANRQRRLTLNFAIGLMASVIGGIVATSVGAPAQLGLGAALAVVAAFLFSWGSFACVRHLGPISPIGSASLTLIGGAFSTSAVLVVLILSGRDDLMPPSYISTQDATYLLIYAFAGMALSQAMWIASVGRLGVAVASMHINLAPFYVMVLLVALGNGWSWPQALGAGIVAAGVILSQRR